jgi:hypothetical protein
MDQPVAHFQISRVMAMRGMIFTQESALVDAVSHRLAVKAVKPWRHKGGEEVYLLLILNLGTSWG